MLKDANRTRVDDIASERRQRFLEAIAMQEIEGNPLTSQEIEMFEMFEREGWPDEKCLTHILSLVPKAD